MNNWSTATLADIALPRGLVGGPFGSKLVSKDYVNQGTPVIRGKNLTHGRWVSFEDSVFVTAEKVDRDLRGNLAEPGDIIYTQRGTLGQVAVIAEGADNSVISQSQMRLRVDPSKVDPMFVYYWSCSPDFQQAVFDHAIVAGVPHINLGILGELPIPIPPLATQARIASILGFIDNLIENNRRRVEVLEEMARAIYREWFVKFRYPGHEDVPLVDSPLGPIPEGWQASTIGEVIQLKYGKALKADARRGGSVSVVSSAGIVGWHDETLVEGPAIVVGRKGNVGSVHWVDGPCWPIDTAYYVDTDLPLRFVVEQLRRAEFTNSHAAVPGLSRESAYALPFLSPPSQLLSSFQALIDPLGSQASALLLQCEKLVGLRDLLLPKLVTGQINVSALNLDALLEEHVA